MDVWSKYGLEAIPVAPEPHIVQPGETIWHIARLYKLPGDIRKTVDIIRELNGLWGPDGPRLQAGQMLKVPETNPNEWALAVQKAWAKAR
ncbi:MAG TPA: LysM peptidoglycan-binding domain-containing protein [Firmicutes bacterium]|nr:LysM peptidoglycan-binding domain-containing protein [Bacillota bacterium]